MKAKTSSASTAQQVSDNAFIPWNLMSDFGRQQLALVTETASTMYRGNESLRKIQQDASHQASVCCAEAAEKLSGPCQPAEILSIQTELMRNNMQGASQYWQQFTAVALQTQREMMSSMTHMLDNEKGGGGIKSALEAFQASIPPMATSFFASNTSASNEHH
ncbi:MAG: hypothetical protein JWP96_2021 [Polaromonas sp.]|nr:hypothetical protein [Polaromonas sp.]